MISSVYVKQHQKWTEHENTKYIPKSELNKVNEVQVELV